ncbi:MAG: TonB-dependent receptor plug domain-containing protein [Gammaproteobacteria bacterium]
MSASAAHAQTSVEAPSSQSTLYDIDIPAQPLPHALAQLSEQTRVQVLYTQQEPYGVLAPAVKGRFSAADALNQLLAGSGLTWREVRPGAVTLEKAFNAGSDTADTTVPANVIVTDPLSIAGSRDNADEDRPYTTSGSSTHISRQKIERFRGTSVGDIFQGTPGVLIGENRNSGGLDVNIRGMQGQSRVPVLLDGARQETTVWRGYAGVSSRTYVDPDLIGGIDITQRTLGDSGGHRRSRRPGQHEDPRRERHHRR